MWRFAGTYNANRRSESDLTKLFSLMMRIEVQLADIVADLPATYQRFYASSEAERSCAHCGAVHPGRDHQAWHAALAASGLLDEGTR